MSIITILPSGQIISVSGAASSDSITVSQDTTDTTVVTINQGQQGPAGVSITVDNYGNNRITTSDGTAGGLYAESDLTFDGNKLRVSGIEVSMSGHSHTASDITNFNEAVDDRIGSGLFVAGTGISLIYNDGSNSFTVATTGVSFSGHTHTVSNITDITSFGSGIVTASSYAAQNKLGWQIVSSSITAAAGGQYLLPKSSISVTGITISDPASATNGDFYLVIKNSGNGATTTVIGGVSYPQNSGVIVYRIYNIDSLFPSVASWKSFTLDNYHQHGAADIIGISGYINNNINTYFSGLSIISNNCDADYFVIRDSGNNTKLISTSGLADAISVIDGGGVLYSGC